MSEYSQLKRPIKELRGVEDNLTMLRERIRYERRTLETMLDAKIEQEAQCTNENQD